jgi:hypothetical protein
MRDREMKASTTSRRSRLPAGAALLTIMSVGAAAYALPGPAACLTVAGFDLQSGPDGVLTDDMSSADQQHFAQITREARSRIGATFGAPRSRPRIVFFSHDGGLGPFALNRYGSTQFIGRYACVFIGPGGRNVDVVAHELMHAELQHRVGALKRILEIPTWFDEGVAMQVDYRKKYDLPHDESVDTDAVRKLVSPSKFNASDDRALTRHYAMSKTMVASWLSGIGPSALYGRLAQINQGKPFADVMEDRTRADE